MNDTNAPVADDLDFDNLDADKDLESDDNKANANVTPRKGPSRPKNCYRLGGEADPGNYFPNRERRRECRQ